MALSTDSMSLEACYHKRFAIYGNVHACMYVQYYIYKCMNNIYKRVMLVKEKNARSCTDHKPVVAVDPICDIMANARGDNLSVGVNSSI